MQDQAQAGKEDQRAAAISRIKSQVGQGRSGGSRAQEARKRVEARKQARQERRG